MGEQRRPDVDVVVRGILHDVHRDVGGHRRAYRRADLLSDHRAHRRAHGGHSFLYLLQHRHAVHARLHRRLDVRPADWRLELLRRWQPLSV